MAGCLTGGAAFVAVTGASRLYFVNAHGPLDTHVVHGWLASLGSGVAGAVLVLAAVWAAARLSGPALALTVGVLATSVWLLPRAVDVHESWEPQPNPRWSCTGWSFTHYPPGVSDADATTYCVGLETRIPDG
ncbi:hypothetical protein [uncultured Nocardioides sp.]|uniref:hypothetical protein n=1 Tax=uncultured Nocardioides sp. TaxID=198441 RepID=UPI0025FA9DBD|nr:hypothetical protein [uncultured Nocardioides sp.]